MFSFIYTLYPNLDIYNDMRMLKWNLTDSGIELSYFNVCPCVYNLPIHILAKPKASLPTLE